MGSECCSRGVSLGRHVRRSLGEGRSLRFGYSEGRLRFYGVALLIALSGCKAIRSVRVESGQPLALTAAEAKRLRADGLNEFAEQPRTLIRVTHAAMALEQAARTLRDDYDAQWQATEALAFLAENDSRPAFREEAAKRAVVLARHGRELNADRVECHYWYAVSTGLLADVDRSYGLNAVVEMEAALKRAAAIDERYDHAGPMRLMAILHLRTPAPPVSMGSPRRGLRLLERAVELFPDYPENYLYLAEALRDNGRADEARQALAKVIGAPPWPDRQFEFSRWKTDAQKLLAEIATGKE
jgi:tetratricopeptide (TPR) repeat protein